MYEENLSTRRKRKEAGGQSLNKQRREKTLRRNGGRLKTETGSLAKKERNKNKEDERQAREAQRKQLKEKVFFLSRKN